MSYILHILRILRISLNYNVTLFEPSSQFLTERCFYPPPKTTTIFKRSSRNSPGTHFLPMTLLTTSLGLRCCISLLRSTVRVPSSIGCLIGWPKVGCWVALWLMRPTACPRWVYVNVVFFVFLCFCVFVFLCFCVFVFWCLSECVRCISNTNKVCGVLPRVWIVYTYICSHLCVHTFYRYFLFHKLNTILYDLFSYHSGATTFGRTT